MINGNIHYKWSFSIAMLNYQRVPFITVWGPPVINVINTIVISTINHSEIGVINQLSYLGGLTICLSKYV
jgi:hypothetical protein